MASGQKGFLFILLICSLFAGLVRAADREDERFLEMVAKSTFQYFWEEANPENGLIPDATRNQNCSISVTGFGLAGICIADSRGWVPREEAYERVLTTLRSFTAGPAASGKTRVASEHGHHYHWVDLETGEWSGEEGIFPTDTAAFIAGVLTAGEYYKGTEVEELANRIYRDVDWTWFLNKDRNTVYVGYTPSGGFYGEYSMTEIGTLFLLLGIGSPTHPLPVETWYNLGNSYFHAEYGEFAYVGDAAAYTHQCLFVFSTRVRRRTVSLIISRTPGSSAWPAGSGAGRTRTRGTGTISGA